MDDLLTYLYDYTMEHLPRSGEYRLNCRCAERHLAQLEHSLTPEQRRHLEAYRDSAALANHSESTAVFRSALSMGLYLGSLHHP